MACPSSFIDVHLIAWGFKTFAPLRFCMKLPFLLLFAPFFIYWYLILFLPWISFQIGVMFAMLKEEGLAKITVKG